MSNRKIQALFASCRHRLLSKPRSLKEHKAIEALSSCRTAALGSHHYVCEQGHRVEHHHSCRHRSCYVCAQRARAQWVDRQQNRLLDTAHFHVIFTLPHEYLPLWRYNEAWFSRALFEASQRSLQQLLMQEAHGGYRPGILISLHTWGRQLTLHPHTHCLVTAGGITASGTWRDSGEFLLPVAVLKVVYRGKVQGLIKQAVARGEVTLPPSMTVPEFEALHRSLFKKAWSVRIEERYGHGRGVLLYLARYCKGGPLNPAQLSGEGEAMVLGYFDHRTQRRRVLSLSAQQLCERLLWHVPAPGVHTVRYYGLYAPAEKLSCKASGLPARLQVTSLLDAGPQGLLQCHGCGAMLRCIGIQWPSHYRKGNSLYREASPCNVSLRSGGHVQPGVEADIASGARIDSS